MDVRGEVGVVDGTEGETVGPAAAEVGYVNILTKRKQEKRGIKLQYSERYSDWEIIWKAQPPSSCFSLNALASC